MCDPAVEPFWENLRDALTGVLARCHGDQIRVRVVQELAHEFLSGVTGGTDDRDVDALKFRHG